MIEPSLCNYPSSKHAPKIGQLADKLHAVRDQVRRQAPLFEKRQKLLSEIKGFWPLVIEQAPPDIDEYIQPSDSNLLVTALASLSVSHFEAEDGDPRSVAIRFEFEENEYFEDRVIEKKFWHRRGKDGWTGFVSEPVDIKWKEGKDLTEGLLGLAKAVWDEEQAAGTNGAAGSKDKELTPKQKALQEKMNGIGLGGVSFFAWFGFRGPKVSAEESKLATKEEKERRQRRAAGEEVSTPKNDEEDDVDDGEEFEIFPSGDQLGLAIAEDLWPNAIKYFSKSSPIMRVMSNALTHAADQAQEDDALSDASFEDFDDEAGLSQLESDDEDESERPAKKRKA